MNEKLTTFLLSFVSGFADTAGFIALGGIFTAHVTGNFVLAGASLARFSTDGILPKLLMFPVFVAAVGATFLISCRLESAGKNALFALLAFEAVFLAAFSATGWFFQPSPELIMTEMQTVATGAVGVAAMAIQNALMKLHLPKLTMTTVMTGNVTQISMDATKVLFGIFKPDNEQEQPLAVRRRISQIGVVVAGFLCGAIGGALLFVKFGLLSVLVPAAAVMALAFGARRKRLENHPNG